MSVTPKALHRAIKDLLALEKKLFYGEEHESLHDEADRLDLEFSGFTNDQKREGFEMYSCHKPFSRHQPKIVVPVRKNIKEKFFSGEALSF